MRHQKSWLAITLLVVGVSLYGPVNAQKLYRCGSAYQDRPCEGEPGRVVGNAIAENQTTSKQSVDSECARRGVDAQKIAWAREAGKTADAQLALTTNTEERRLIADAYRKNGSAALVRAAIEADCVTEKEKAMQAALLIAAAHKLRGTSSASTSASASTSSPASTLPSGPTEAEQKIALSQEKEASEARQSRNKIARCSGLNSSLDNLRDQQRTGGSAIKMETLSRQREELDKSLRESRC
jgi:hypothetical protein